MPPRLLMRCITRTHIFWYRLTGGRIGGRVVGTPVLLLTTTGRKSGRAWTTPLSYLEDDGSFVVIASAGGSPRHPAWYHNLHSQPAARIEIPGQTLAVTAETASTEDKARLWPRITAMYAGYDDYQRRTSRDIPVVL